MSINSPQDALSAYFDGEISPEERLQIEQELMDSPQARCALVEYRQVSELLRALPHVPAPDEFRVRVMQAAERETLLPSEDALVPAPAASRRWNKLVVSAAATAVLAASVVFMLTWFGTESSETMRETSETGVALSDLPVPMKGAAPAEAPVLAERIDLKASDADMLVADAAEGREVADAAKAGPTVMDLQPSQTALALTESKAAKEPFAGKLSEALPSEMPQPPLPAPWQLKFDGQKLGDAEVGQVVEALATSPDRVAVVRLTVIDKQKGLESLQLLLARHQILPETQTLSDKEQATRKAGSVTAMRDQGLEIRSDREPTSQTAESDRLVAVYVESSQTQLSSALLDLQREGLFRDLAIEPPIQVASLDSLTQSQISRGEMSVRTTGQAGVSESVAEKGPPKPAAAPTPAREPMKSDMLSQRRRASEAVSGGMAPSASPAAPTSQEPLAEAMRIKRQEEADAGPVVSQLAPTAQDRLVRDQPSKQSPDQASRQLALSVPSDLLSASVPAFGAMQKKAPASSLGTDAKEFAFKGGQREKERVVQTQPDKNGMALGLDAARNAHAAAGPLQVLFVLVSNDGVSITPPPAPAKPTAPAHAPTTPPRPDNGAA